MRPRAIGVSDLRIPGDVKVAITYFFDRSSLDVDNVPKPILDALNGLVYFDESPRLPTCSAGRET